MWSHHREGGRCSGLNAPTRAHSRTHLHARAALAGKCGPAGARLCAPQGPRLARPPARACTVTTTIRRASAVMRPRRAQVPNTGIPGHVALCRGPGGG
eukprot:199142-Prymnesium_polylepis.2